jgi:hypothetical protein
MRGKTMCKFLWFLLFLVILFALIGCSDNTIVAGKNGNRIKIGEWTGIDDDGTYLIQFIVATDRSRIIVPSYVIPCGEESYTKFLSDPIKIEIKDNSFEMKLDQIKLAGKFIDRTHVVGTWEVFLHQDIYLDIVCPAANGTWEGSPN